MDPGPEGSAPHLGAYSLSHVDVACDVRQALQLAGELLQFRNAVPHTSSHKGLESLVANCVTSYCTLGCNEGCWPKAKIKRHATFNLHGNQSRTRVSVCVCVCVQA